MNLMEVTHKRYYIMLKTSQLNTVFSADMNLVIEENN